VIVLLSNFDVQNFQILLPPCQ